MITPRAVNAMEGQIRQITNEILDRIADKRECDFVLDVSSQLPLAVICGMSLIVILREWILVILLCGCLLLAFGSSFVAIAQDPTLIATAIIIMLLLDLLRRSQ